MQTGWAFYTREERRHFVPDSESASVEFDYPNPDGPKRQLPLLDVSATGLSFLLTRPLAGIEGGSSFTGVVIRFGDLSAEGELLLSHVTNEAEGRTVCGGRFFPLTPADELKLNKILKRLEPAHADPC